MKDTVHFICQDRNIESEKISGLQRHDLKRLYLAKIPPGKKNMDDLNKTWVDTKLQNDGEYIRKK